MKTVLFLYFLLNCVQYIYPYVFSSVEKCSYTDYKCLKRSFQKAVPLFTEGIPELGIERMDELVVHDKIYKLGGLDLTLKDARLKGLKTTVFDHVRYFFICSLDGVCIVQYVRIPTAWNLIDTNKKMLFTSYHIVKCSMKGKYEGVGNIKVLPLRGSGEIFLKFRNVALSVNSTYVMENRNNKEYLIPKSYVFEYEVKDYAHFNMTNLFSGNEKLSNAVLTFLNENWRDVSKEFGKPIIEGQTKQIFDNVVKYLSNSPVTEIFLL
ncbi:circadian clock-controlled protein daywake-like isoform X1 [Pieris napi]|uniref:circadian clock-controlled protein daywake-like isoform X1 n=1 Tax=Pieris napi TaxID=78633 RepID=UPI001FBAF389|nr:circadian clock-controlled protein daywake-like isoform X1 [Pieris napi]